MITPLPASPQVPIRHLAAGFNNVTTAYKFYWFWQLLRILAQGERI
jgi:hypothetical protein